MRFGDTWTPVELLDESAGGFGVRIEHIPEVAVGDVVHLRQGDKCFEVEVMHVTQHLAEESSDEAGEGGRAACQLGLKRLSEVFGEVDVRPSWLKQIRSTWQRPRMSLNGKGLAVGLGLAFLVGALPVIIVMVLESTPAPDPQLKSAVDDGIDLESLKIVQNPFKVDLDKEPNGPTAAVTRGENFFADKSLNEQQKAVWQKLLDRAKQQTDVKPWNDGALALMSNLTGRLNLTDLQKVEISQILKYANNALANLQVSVSKDDREKAKAADKRSSILEEAYVGLMHMLSDEQKSKFEKLVQEPPASEPTP